jgi:hypothetical protein
MNCVIRKSWWFVPVVLLTAVLPVVAQEAQAVVPFNGTNFDGWTCKGQVAPDQGGWNVGIAKLDPANPRALVAEPAPAGKGEMVCKGRGRDIHTLQKFGDCSVEIEVMVPERSNSGIYLMGQYEIQVLDSFGKPKPSPGDMGGIYGNKGPDVNASKKPGEWQKFVIEFRAPRFDQSGKKVSNAKFIRVTLNDQVIHENVELKGSTGGALSREEVAEGPLMLQGDHGPVAYRNIKITPRK